MRNSCKGCNRSLAVDSKPLCVSCLMIALSPTKAAPGSVEKIAVLQLRAILEIDLDHPFDRRIWEGQIWNFLQAVDKIPTFIESLAAIGEEQL